MSLMADISQFVKRESELFTALSPDAQTWMRENYENESVVFRLPSEQLPALEFRRAADEKGFSVEFYR